MLRTDMLVDFSDLHRHKHIKKVYQEVKKIKEFIFRSGRWRILSLLYLNRAHSCLKNKECIIWRVYFNAFL